MLKWKRKELRKEVELMEYKGIWKGNGVNGMWI